MNAVTPKPTSPADLRSHHVRVGEMEWQKTRFPGCEVKTLLFDRDCGLVTALMRFAPSPQSPAPFLGEGAGAHTARKGERGCGRAFTFGSYLRVDRHGGAFAVVVRRRGARSRA